MKLCSPCPVDLFTLSCCGYRVKMRNCTVRYSGCTVSGRHPARHLHRTDVLREQLPASRAYCDCTVPSTHLPAVVSYMIRMKTSQKQARKTCKVNILYTQCIRMVLRSSFLQRTACAPPLVVGHMLNLFHHCSILGDSFPPNRRERKRCKRDVLHSGTHRQITAGFVMAREAGITSFTK